jgi:hypothetical protein
MNFLKSHGIALGILFAATIIFCLPAIQGKVLNSHDYVSWQYMSNESKVFTDAQGGYAYWTNAQFGGLPSFNTYGTKTGNFLGELQFTIMPKYIPRPLYIMFLCAIGFYVLCCALGFGLLVRIAGSLAFTFSSYNPILASAGHDTKLIAIGASAGVLAGIFYMLKGRTWLGLAVYTLFFAILFTSGHYQIIYYLLIALAIMGVFAIVEAQKNGNMKHVLFAVAFTIGSSLIGVLPAVQSLLMIKDYTNATMRGGQSPLTLNKDGKKPKSGGLDREYAFRWSQGIGETISLVVPNVCGPMGQENYVEGATAEKLTELGVNPEIANQLPDYWGPQPFLSGPVYFGAIIFFLFLLGMFVVDNSYKWWIAIASVFFIVLSWGRNFPGLNNFLFDYLPAYNKFRTPSMALVIPQLLWPLLGAWGLNDIITGKVSKEQAFTALKKAGIIAAALVLIGGVFSSVWQDFKSDNMEQVRQQMTSSFGGPEKASQLISAMKEDMAGAARADGLRSLILILLAAGLVFAFIKDKVSAKILGIALAILIVGDLFMVSKRYLKDEQYVEKEEYEAQMFGARQVDNEILKDTDPFYRVQDLSVNTYNDSRPSYFHKMVGGYHPAKMEIYQDLIDIQLSKHNGAVYNMLNTRYFIVPGGQDQNAPPRLLPRNANACGNAWFVSGIKNVANADEEMLALNAPSLFGDTTLKGDFNPLATAIVQKDRMTSSMKNTYIKDSSARIALTKYGLNDLEYNSTNTSEGFAVFSDIYYDGGWHAYVDGKETPIVRCNYVLRGIAVPAGNHKITFNFTPPKADIGRTLGTIGSILTLLITAFGLWKNYKEQATATKA